MKKIFITFISLFIICLFTLGMFTFIGKKDNYSENENRYLADKPNLSFTNIIDGDFQKQITSYMSDRFLARDKFMKFSTQVKLVEGKKDVGGVYKGKDNYYFEKVTENDIDKKQFNSNLSRINDFALSHKNIDTSVMLVPSSSRINRDLLPKYAEIYNSDAMFDTARSVLSNCKFIDTTKQLRLNDNQTYYKTDHHWTSFGAYAGYKQYCNDCNINFIQTKFEKVSNSFLGTLFSKTLDYKTIADSVYLPMVKEPISVTADGKNIKMYCNNELNSKDKYKVFFDGNYGKVEINTNFKNRKQIVIIKDSFANSFVPFLTQNYSKIIMIDYRYFSESISNLIKTKNTSVLFLYEMSNFANDKNLVKLQMFN